MFAVISAMSHQIGAMSADLASFQTDFDERFKSLSVSHELLVREDWRSVPIVDLVCSHLAFVSGAMLHKLPLFQLCLAGQPNCVTGRTD
jgi:two-component sensor histidine kinase